MPPVCCPPRGAIVFAATSLLIGACTTGSLSVPDGAQTSSTTVTSPTPSPEPTTLPSGQPSGFPPHVVLAPTEIPAEPAALAAALTDAERAIRDPATSAADLSRYAERQQEAYRILVDNPDLLPAVTSLLDAGLRNAVTLNTNAGIASRQITEPQSHFPAWRIVAPRPADTLLGYYQEAEAALGIPWEYLAAVNLVETRMGRIRGTSSAGAQGPMQFLPSTWELYGEGGDINDHRDSIFAAARYLAANSGTTDIDHALYRYNRSDHYVETVGNYAEVMIEDPRAYYGYYDWQVYYRHVDGIVILEEGYAG